MYVRRGGRWELADVFRIHGNNYRCAHRLPPSHAKVIEAIEACRTEKLGGHMEMCSRCGFERPCYNSCRNRHCPKCQGLTKARWLEARKSELLPVPYFHVVFTLPHELNALALSNKKVVYGILFQSVSKTLLTFGERALGGKIAATMILHTWDQQLRDHLHIHCSIPAGALSQDGLRWVSARRNFLFPVKAMAIVFRGKFLDALKRSHDRKQLGWSSVEFHQLVRSLYEKSWVVYSKPAFKGPQSVLDYIGRYTHRIAISNERLRAIDANSVTFSYRDRQDGNQKKEMTLSGDEFMRRFLLHTLPSSFMKIRHIGFLANKSKKTGLERCREFLGTEAVVVEPKPTRELLKELTGLDLDHCPSCQLGTMLVSRDIAPLNTS